MLHAKRRRQARKRRRGAALVEFALVVPVALAFLFGMFELCRMVMVQQSLTSAAHRGCREATLATSISNDDVEATVRDYLRGPLGAVADSGALEVDITPASLAGVSSGDDVSVQVRVGSASVSWVRNPFLGSNTEVTLVGQSSRTRE